MMQTVFFNEKILSRLAKISEAGRLAHAYLFIGPRSSGKTETALALAKSLNCAAPKGGIFCDACPSCIKINGGNHADVQVFEAITSEEEDAGLVNPRPGEKPEKNKNLSIRISQVRHINSRIQLRAFEAKTKVVIIKDIENFSDDAANAFLKTLEEPSRDTLIILTAVAPEKIIATIKSRAQTVNFFPVSGEALEAALIKSGRLDAVRAHFLANFSEGSFGKAVELNDAKTFERKNAVIDQFIFTQNSEPFIQGIVSDKDKTKEALSILLTWFRDLVLLKSSIDELKLIHSDRVKDLKALAPKFTFEELQEAVRDIAGASRLLEENLNMKVALTLLKEKLWKR